jgi:hypothetical protein
MLDMSFQNSVLEFKCQKSKKIHQLNMMRGTALVSGFSPALLTSLLAGDDLSPVTMMNRVVNPERLRIDYNIINISFR